MVHKRPLAMVASESGRGILFADFVSSTVFRAANGDMKSALHTTTPLSPMILVLLLSGESDIIAVAAIKAVAKRTCCETVPGNVGAAFGANLMNRAQ